MKITLEQGTQGEPEIILRYREMTDELLHLLTFLNAKEQKLMVWSGTSEMIPLNPEHILYCESVDEKVFVYCKQDVYQTALTLLELETQYTQLGFFRISKSVVVNLRRIAKLTSCPSGKIHVLLENKETVVVSRHYAPLLRERLKNQTK